MRGTSPAVSTTATPVTILSSEVKLALRVDPKSWLNQVTTSGLELGNVHPQPRFRLKDYSFDGSGNRELHGSDLTWGSSPERSSYTESHHTDEGMRLSLTTPTKISPPPPRGLPRPPSDFTASYLRLPQSRRPRPRLRPLTSTAQEHQTTSHSDQGNPASRSADRSLSGKHDPGSHPAPHGVKTPRGHYRGMRFHQMERPQWNQGTGRWEAKSHEIERE